MHATGSEPSAGRGGRPGPALPPSTRWSLALVVVVVCVAYGSLLRHWFYSDDFLNLLLYRDVGLDGWWRFLLHADLGDRPWVYWRPGWVGLFQSVHALAGTTAWPYYLVAVLLHAGTAAVVCAIARRATGSDLLALAVALLFALMPSHVEAVAWVSAAFNVLPAGLLLAVAGWWSWRVATATGGGGG